MTTRLLLPLSIALLLIASSAGAAEPVKLKIAATVSAAEPFIGVPVVRFKEEVERETGKALVLEIFDKGKPYNDGQIVSAVQAGAVEMALAPLYGISRVLPAAGFMEQPFLFNFDGLTQAATSPESDLRKLIDDAILGKMGLRVLWWSTIGPQAFFSKAGDARDPSSIRGKKMRAGSPTTSAFATRCGGLPVIVSTTKVQEAMADGMLDMVMMAPAGVWTRDLWKVSAAVTRTDHSTVEFLVVINEKSWQSLSKEHQSTLVQAARRVERDARARSVQLNQEAYDFARGKGMQVYELSPHQVAEWRACSSDVLVDFMAKGGELAQALMSAYGKLRTAPCCSAGPPGDKNSATASPFHR